MHVLLQASICCYILSSNTVTLHVLSQPSVCCCTSASDAAGQGFDLGYHKVLGNHIPHTLCSNAAGEAADEEMNIKSKLFTQCISQTL